MGDLNHLLHHEQLSLLHAQHSGCADMRAEHRGEAHSYGARIRDHRLPYRSPAASTGRTAFVPFVFGSEGRGI
ncbi:hypothetical protein J2W40_000671 [Sphingobium xenophagum]|uniref:Uncharacterized protein n=1 Tax=Sphingobium xenophagum TaxID=121428 RepID=A0ABU1WX35_SPHXE|nr:hypothetical protein [Sphingobium xenophagum]MDR7153868.1 hypothetical protein [Sphingobium xenophagum]